jgi:hypothetical protein
LERLLRLRQPNHLLLIVIRNGIPSLRNAAQPPLADGTHEVVISIKGSDAYSECFLGKIEVKEGKMAGKLQIQKMDGSYGDFDKKATAFYTNESGQVKDELRFVNSGMSEEFTSTDGEVVRLFFYKSLAEKPKANKKAPSPSALIKN